MDVVAAANGCYKEIVTAIYQRVDSCQQQLSYDDVAVVAVII